MTSLSFSPIPSNLCSVLINKIIHTYSAEKNFIKKRYGSNNITYNIRNLLFRENYKKNLRKITI